MKCSNLGSDQKLKAVIIILFFLYIFVSFIKPILDPDTPWHLKTGEYILLHKTILTTDPFSFAQDTIPFYGKFILTQYWLAQIFFFQIYKTFGAFGLVLLGATIFTLILIILWSLLKNKGLYISCFITGGFAFNVLTDFSAIRPQIFTFLFVAVVIFLLEKYKEKDSLKYLLPFPFLMIFWANMHGGFIYGIVLMFIYAIEGFRLFSHKNPVIIQSEKASSKHFRYLLFFCVISLLVSLVNPNTYKAFMYVFVTHSQNLFANIDEYQSPLNLKTVIIHTKMILSFWSYVFVAMILIVILIKRRDINPILVLLFAVTPTLFSIRYIPLFAIVATATIRHIPINVKFRVSPKMNSIMNTVIIMFLAVLIFVANPFKDRSIYKLNDSSFYPVSASEFLIRNKISGNIFSSYNKSAFLIFTLFPESKVYSDSRFINEERIKKSLRIQGEFDSIDEKLENINRLIPKNIGTIKINFVEPEKKQVNREAPQSQNNFTDNKSWKDLLDDTGAEIIVHEAVNYYTGNIYPLIFKLIDEDSWKLIYSDGNVLIFVRDKEKFKDIIAQYKLPKTTVYNEIIKESRYFLNRNISNYYSSAALALLLKGIAHDKTLYLIEKSLSLDPHNIYAEYCNALYVLMTHKQ